MTHTGNDPYGKNGQSKQHVAILARRLTLLASTAGLAIALLAVGPGGSVTMRLPTWTSSARAATAAAQHPASFANLVAKVKPAVISVRVKIEETGDITGDKVVPFAPGSPMEKFFKQFGTPRGALKRHQIITGEGSGFFISADGYAVTNDHVVDNATSVQITTDDEVIYTAKVIGADPKTDLALIKVDGKTDFPYVKFADQAPRVGDWVVAVGNPFGLGGTVTAGIVSARGRDIGAGAYDDYIQIDAPINRGNSGGPAFNVDGDVIGVNTAIFSPSGGSVGIGFDIPADSVKMVIAQLKEHGFVTRGWLGAQVQTVSKGIADSLGMKKAEGALVDEAQSGSPAAKAGLEAGDVITAVNGAPVKDSRELVRTIGGMAPDSSVKLEVLRQGETKTLTAKLAQMPKERQARIGTEKGVPGSGTPNAPSPGTPNLGLSVEPANSVEGAGDKGVIVTGVDPDGPAAQQGIRPGHIILDVGGKAVANDSDMRKAVADAKGQGRHEVLMRVKTAKASMFVAVPIG
jgi:serine protease Do